MKSFLKEKKPFKLLSILALLFSTFNIVGCFGPKEKEFSAGGDELKITLTENFEQSGSLDSTTSLTMGLVFESNDNTVLIQIFKYKNSSFENLVLPNLTEFARIANYRETHYDKENQLCYVDEYQSSGNYKKIFFFKTIDAYYEAQFQYVESNDERIYDWAKSIKFAKGKVYDINESMTDTKKIILDTQDYASINIGTAYMKFINEDTYHRVLLSGAIDTTQIKIEKINKEGSNYETLNEFASASGYTNRNLTGKTYVSLTGTSYVFGLGNCQVIVYCFESSNNYYKITVISNNAKIATYDSYADTFTAN